MTVGQLVYRTLAVLSGAAVVRCGLGYAKPDAPGLLDVGGGAAIVLGAIALVIWLIDNWGHELGDD